MKMNKKDVMEELKKKLNLSEEDCTILNDIFEGKMFIGKKNKEKIVDEISEKLSKSKEEADEIFNSVMDVIGSGIKDKLLHPFRNQD